MLITGKVKIQEKIRRVPMVYYPLEAPAWLMSSAGTRICLHIIINIGVREGRGIIC